MQDHPRCWPHAFRGGVSTRTRCDQRISEQGGGARVKCHFFHLMPYPELPDDFRQRYHGVWVDLPSAELFDANVGYQAYNDYLDELEFADQAGFDGICVNEHHQNAYGLMPSPNLMIAALARS